MSAQKELLEKLKPWLSEERCRTCDCLQGALVQMELDGEGQVKELAAANRVPSEKMHPCLGCEPCPPAEAWSEYIRKQNRSSTLS